MAERVTQEQIDVAHLQWRAQVDQVEDFSNPTSVRFRQANPKHRPFMLESFRRYADEARTRYEDLLQRFDRQQRIEREQREEELLRRRVEAEEETARQLARQSAMAARATHPGERPMNEKLQSGLQKKEANRLRVLQTLYEVTDGNEHASAEMGPLYEQAGVEYADGDAAYHYLQGEGLVMGKSSHRMSITHHGVVEIEQAINRPKERTEHFTPVVIQQVFHGAVGAVQTGADAVANVQQQNNAAPAPELVRLFAELRAKTAELPADERADATELVDDLEEQSKRTKPNAKKVDLLATGLSAVQTLGPTVATIVSTILANQ